MTFLGLWTRPNNLPVCIREQSDGWYYLTVFQIFVMLIDVKQIQSLQSLVISH